MTPTERVRCVLEGRRPDRPPVSFWHHFTGDQVYGQAALDAHLAHVHAFDLDFLKVMNDNPYPHEGVVQSVKDLSSLVALRGDEAGFGRQLILLSDLKRELKGRVPMATTVFNAYATLRRLLQPPTGHGPPDLDAAASDEPTRTIKKFFEQDPALVKAALATIGRSLSNFARRCIQAGADGVFLSVRDDWLTSAGLSYAELVRPVDLVILEGAADGWFNLLHVCGRPVDMRAFGEYPVHAINWADRAAGPSIAEVSTWMKPTICGGLDNQKTLPQGTPADCEKEVSDALQQAGDRSIMIAPGCTYDPDTVPRAKLQAVCRAVRNS